MYLKPQPQLPTWSCKAAKSSLHGTYTWHVHMRWVNMPQDNDFRNKLDQAPVSPTPSKTPKPQHEPLELSAGGVPESGGFAAA